jgi:hypothetical protein
MASAVDERLLWKPNLLSCASLGVSYVSRNPSSVSVSSASVMLNREVSSERTRDVGKHTTERRVDWPRKAKVEWRDSGLGVG